MEFKNILSKIICRICKEQFKEPKALFKHLQQKHDTGPALKDHRTCSICGVQCAKNESYREHMLHIHGLRNEPQKLTFKNLNDFLLWKVELENKYNCQYVLQSAPKLLPSNERKYFYQCDRAGQDRPKSRERKITTITKKSCPSVILVLEGTGILKVEYWDKHVGHSRNFETGRGDELTSAISTLEMMQNMDSEDFDDSLTENFAYNTDFDCSPSLTKSLKKRSPRKRGKTTTSNLTSSQNVIRTFYSPSNSGTTQKKPASSVLFSLASVACGKINKNIISEKKVINPPSMEIASSKSSSSISVNNKPSKNDTVAASTSKVGATSASSSTTCVTSSTSSVPVVSPSTSSVSVTPSLSTEQTAASSSVSEVTPIKEATTLSSPVHNDSSSALSDIRASSPIDDIDTSSPVDEIDKPFSGSESESSSASSSNKMATSSSKTVNLTQLSATVSVSSSTTSATETKNATKATSSNNVTKTTSSNQVTKTTSSVKNITKTSSPSHLAGTTSSTSMTTKSSVPSSVKASSPSVTNVTASPITNLVQTSTLLGPNIKNTATPLILSNAAPNQFYVLGPAIGTQSNFGANLSNVILCPAGQNIIAPNTVITPTVPSSILKNSDENRKRKAETESPNQNSPNVKKKPSAQEAVNSPASGSVSTTARILNSIGGNQLLTNYIGSAQSSGACMSSNANNKIVLSHLPPMSFVNINNQLIPISTAGAPLSLSSASVPIGQSPVAFNMPATSVLKNSIGSENDASSSSTSKPPNSISALPSTPVCTISKPSVHIYNRTEVREGESNSSKPLSSSTSILKSSTSSTKSCTPSESNLNVEHGYSNAKKRLMRTKLESISNVSTPKKGKASTPTANLTVSPIKTNDQSIIARTISCVVKENSSITSVAGLNSTNSTLSKVISVASQIAKTVASGKNVPLSTSNVPKVSANAKRKPSATKTYARKGANVPSIMIPPIPSDTEHSRSFVFESAGDVYMLQPVENDKSKTGEHKLPELIKVKNNTTSVQTLPSAKYSYFNYLSKSSASPEKTDLKDDSEIMKKVKYYQLEMKYLSSQEECKRLKVELAKTKLKNKELSEKSGFEIQPSVSSNHVDNQKECCIQAEELIKAFEKRCESDQDSNIYALVRTSVLRSLYEDVQELSATNKKQYNELKGYRDHDTFYKSIRQELED